MKFLELFNPITKGDFGLTEEATYKSIQLGNNMIPLWGGNQEHVHADRFIDEKAKTKHNLPITVFGDEGIIISLDGSSGSMTYKPRGKFALNHHAGFFKPKDKTNQLIDPLFFSVFYQEQLREAGLSSGSKTLTLEQIYSMDFDVPDWLIQEEIMKQLKGVLELKAKIIETLQKLAAVSRRNLSEVYRGYQAQGIPISEVLDYMGGNSGLTEKEVYQKVGLPGEKYQILSGATMEERGLGKVAVFKLRGRPIKVFRDQEGILVVRKGKAGSSKFLVKGKYTLTDDAYILFIREECRYSIELKWLEIQYRGTFMDFSSSSDNGTWNMSGFFDNTRIDIPDIQEQLRVVEEYKKIENLQKGLQKLGCKLRVCSQGCLQQLLIHNIGIGFWHRSVLPLQIFPQTYPSHILGGSYEHTQASRRPLHPRGQRPRQHPCPSTGIAVKPIALS
jgi:hypothetical protein